MKKLRLFGLLAVGLAVALFSSKPLRSALSDIFALQGDGSLYNVDVFRVTSTADVKVSDSNSYTALDIDSATGETIIRGGDLVFGAESTTPSSANAGTYQSVQHRLLNNSGTTIAVGDVVLADVTSLVEGAVNIANANSTTTVVGVAVESIANGSSGLIAVAGLAVVKTTGTIAIGDILVSTAPGQPGTPKGYAGADNTPTDGATIGVALEAGSGTDTVLIKLR